MKLGRWAHLAGAGPFAASAVPSFAGISGGRTSGMMGALLAPSVVRVFQNTGMEHPKTYEFIERLSDAYEADGLSPIVWLEWRPPPTKGDPPRMFGVEVVTPQTAHRGGDLINGVLDAIAGYRRIAKGLGPVEPWARQRICTAYLKHRVMHAWIARSSVVEYDQVVGLRADEPRRVANIRATETAARSYSVPLHDAGIAKCDVMSFWSEQAFDLGIDDAQGNCTGCFLKDQSDLSRLLGEPETQAQVWLDLRKKFPGFGGREWIGYQALLDERPIRLAVADAISRGVHVENDGSVDRRRFRLIVAQEKARASGERAAFSCSCEGSVLLAEDDAQLELFP